MAVNPALLPFLIGALTPSKTQQPILHPFGALSPRGTNEPIPQTQGILVPGRTRNPKVFSSRVVPAPSLGTGESSTLISDPLYDQMMQGAQQAEQASGPYPSAGQQSAQESDLTPGEFTPTPTYPSVLPDYSTENTQAPVQQQPAVPQGWGNAAYTAPQGGDWGTPAYRQPAQGTTGGNQSSAALWGMLAAGLGILANNYGKYGQAQPAVGAGGLMGLQTFLGQKQVEEANAHRAAQLAETTRLGEWQRRINEQQVASQVEAQNRAQAVYDRQQELFTKLRGAQTDGEKNQIIDELAALTHPEALIKARIDQRKIDQGPKPPTGMMWNEDRTGFVWDPNYLQGRKEIATAGATTLQNKIDAFMPASEEIQRDLMREIRSNYTMLRSAPVLLRNIEKAKALVPEAGGFIGSGGETKLAIAKFFNNTLGMSINPNEVASAEELRTRLFSQIMENLKKMDAQPSQLQQTMMMDALGNLGTDPGAIPRVLDVMGDIVRQKVDLHNRDVNQAASRGMKFPYDPLIDISPQQQAPAGPPRISNDAEFEKLPSGTEFIGPDGKRRRKP